jgi:hypothetical protein
MVVANDRYNRGRCPIPKKTSMEIKADVKQNDD